MAGSKRKPVARYRLVLDKRGRVICLDEDGEQVPMGRCFKIGVGEEADQIQVGMRKSCELGEDFEEKIKKRIMAGGMTLWAQVDDEKEEWEEEEEEAPPRRKKRKRKSR